MRRHLLIILLLLAITPAHAWDSGGHMLVTRVAYDRLTPKTRKQVDTLITSLPDVRTANPDSPNRPYDFISAGCWMDDIRGASQYADFAKRHYINVSCEGDPEAVRAPNAVSAIEDSLKTLRSPDGAKGDKVIALAVLMHVVGDIHQPLHCTDRDLGGNTFPIAGIPDMAPQISDEGSEIPRYQRLHAFWDAAYRYGVISSKGKKQPAKLFYPGDSSRPDMAKIAEVATNLLRRYTPPKKDKTTAKEWITQSSELACRFAFNTPAKQQPSLKYFDKANGIAGRRIVQAGCRLASLLNSIFDTNE